MSELAFELRFVIDITELSIYLCLVLGSQNHSEIRQQTRFWRGNSQWQIARCKMPFQSGLWTRWSWSKTGDELRWTPAVILVWSHQGFWHIPLSWSFHIWGHKDKHGDADWCDSGATDVEAAGSWHVMTLSWFMRSPWVLPPDKASPSSGNLPVITGYKWDYTFYKWGYKYL